MTENTDPTTIDVDEVIANITHAFKVRGRTWDDRLSWPNITVLALAIEVLSLRRRLEFIELLADGGEIKVNGVPWREMFERLNAIVSDPVPFLAEHPETAGPLLDARIRASRSGE